MNAHDTSGHARTSRRRHAGFALATAVVLSACGGGGSSSSGAGAAAPVAAPPPAGASAAGPTTGISNRPTTEVINGIVVPPAPDAATNAATLKGVDSNGNGLRDDVERALAAVTKDAGNFTAIVAYAKGYQSILEQPTPASRTAALTVFGALACAIEKIPATERTNATTSNVMKWTFDTDDRRARMAAIAAVTEGGFTADELPSCP